MSPLIVTCKKKHKYPNVNWKMIRRQFQKMLQSLSATELMEMRASFQHKDIGKEREKRLGNIKQIAYERNIGKFKQGYDYEKDRMDHMVLIDGGTQRERIRAQIREQREYNKTQRIEAGSFNLFNL